MEVLRGAWVGIVCLYHISQSAQSHMEKEGISLLFTGKNNLFSLGFQRMQKQKGTRKAWRQNGLTLSNVLKPEKGLVGELAQMEQVVGELDQELAQRQALQAVIEQCEKALKLLKPNSSEGDLGIRLKDSQSDELCNLWKARVEFLAFLNKRGNMQSSNSQEIAEKTLDEFSSWDLVTEADFLEGNFNSVCNCWNQESYVVVTQEDIVEGIACFMARYLSTLKHTKEMTPEQLQEALSKTFTVTKNKGKVHKIWNNSKVIYNVASWSAAAVGVYQNRTMARAVSSALRNSCHVITKFVSK